MSAEVWKSIPSAPDYEASNLGRVRSWKVYRGKAGPRVLKGTPKAEGHLNYGLMVDGRLRFVMGHLLVLEAFVGPRPIALETRHLDGDPANNVLTNICYGTRSENCQDRVRHGSASIENLRRWNARAG